MRAPTLVLHTLEMHVDLSFSYLRFAEAVSFNIKKSYVGAVQPFFFSQGSTVTLAGSKIDC